MDCRDFIWSAKLSYSLKVCYFTILTGSMSNISFIMIAELYCLLVGKFLRYYWILSCTWVIALVRLVNRAIWNWLRFSRSTMGTFYTSITDIFPGTVVLYCPRHSYPGFLASQAPASSLAWSTEVMRPTSTCYFSSSIMDSFKIMLESMSCCCFFARWRSLGSSGFFKIISEMALSSS